MEFLRGGKAIGSDSVDSQVELVDLPLWGLP